MSAFSSFIKNPKGIKYDGKDEDEQILYVLRRAQITNFWWIFTATAAALVPVFLNPYLSSIRLNGEKAVSLGFITVLTLFWYIAIFGLSLFQYLNWFFNVYVITSKKILDFDFYGLTYKNISETTLDNVEDVTSQISGPYNMVFNVGDVFIQTAGEKREFDFVDIDDPGKVRDIIADLVAERKHHHGNN